jgi:hypothetical protein
MNTVIVFAIFLGWDHINGIESFSTPLQKLLEGNIEFLTI